jgi:hypothetical protein
MNGSDEDEQRRKPATPGLRGSARKAIMRM